MTFIKKLAFGLALSATFAASAGVVTQSTAPAGSDSYWNGNGWNHQTLGSVTFATGTNSISALTSTVTLADQGWGNQTPDNGVKMALDVNGTDVWRSSVAGSSHGYSTQTFDITSMPDLLSALNLAMASIDWAASPTVMMEMFTTPYGYGGWELHTRNASFSVTSQVPEPDSLLLFGAALAALALSRRKLSK
jgi:hypothetical protein